MLSLYFHIPFCEKKCNYCNFFIVPKNSLQEDLFLSWQEKYLDSMKKEILQKKKQFSLQKEKIYSIYFGGGTPSLFHTKYYENLIEFLLKEFDLSFLQEFSIEINPDLNGQVNNSLNFLQGFSHILTKFNLDQVFRVSVGIQSLNDDILKLSGRTYLWKDLFYFMKNLDKKFTLNFDFISFGLEENFDNNYFIKFENFVEENLDQIDSFSIYTLELFVGSIWKDKFNTNEEKILQNFKKYKEIVEKYGYKRYEISNFAKIGKESKHNKVYWQMKDYLGIGLSASGYLKSKRSEEGSEKVGRDGRWQKISSEDYQLVRRKGGYLLDNCQIIGDTGDERLDTIFDKSFNITSNHSLSYIRYTNSFAFQDYLKGSFSYSEYEKLDYKDYLIEKVFLGLRTLDGVDFVEVKEILDLKKLETYLKEKYLEIKNNKLVLTDKGFDIYNFIVTDILKDI